MPAFLRIWLGVGLITAAFLVVVIVKPSGAPHQPLLQLRDHLGIRAVTEESDTACVPVTYEALFNDASLGQFEGECHSWPQIVSFSLGTSPKAVVALATEVGCTQQVVSIDTEAKTVFSVPNPGGCFLTATPDGATLLWVAQTERDTPPTGKANVIITTDERGEKAVIASLPPPAAWSREASAAPDNEHVLMTGLTAGYPEDPTTIPLLMNLQTNEITRLIR